MKLLSCFQLLVTPRTAAYQSPPPMGFSRQEYWSGGATAFSYSCSQVPPERKNLMSLSKNHPRQQEAYSARAAAAVCSTICQQNCPSSVQARRSQELRGHSTATTAPSHHLRMDRVTSIILPGPRENASPTFFLPTRLPSPPLSDLRAAG